jgi:hypothetical protein
MTRSEAEAEARKWNGKPDMSARVVRILSEIIDPPRDEDNGWDVEISITLC